MISMFKAGGLAVAFFLAFAGVSTESHASKKMEKKTKTGQKDEVKCESCANKPKKEVNESESKDKKDETHDSGTAH